MIVIIDYRLGNLASIKNALNKLKISSQISNSPAVIKKAKALILPGVGAAGQGMVNLKSKELDKLIISQASKGKPILGICLGMQLLFSYSEEGKIKCLDIIKGRVKKFRPKSKLKVPQIGWNNINIKKDGQIFKAIPNRSFFYFVNSYYCNPEDKSVMAASTNYGIDFCSILVKGNIFGVQFHPEKSGKVGLQLLQNFWEVTDVYYSGN